MSDLGSSPFLERPKQIEDGTEVNLRQVISNLQYQLSCLKAETDLVKQSQTSMVNNYESMLEEKNHRIERLETNLTYVVKEKDQLLSKYTNDHDTSSGKLKHLESQNRKLMKENQQLVDEVADVKEDNFSLGQDVQKLRADLSYSNEVNDQLDERIASLESDNEKLLSYNDDLIKRLDEYSKINTNDLSKFNENLHLKNQGLQETNNQLQIKLDKLLQNKTSNELLKQKNMSLTNQLQQLEHVNEKYSKLEIEKIELENLVQDIFSVLNKNFKSETSDDIDIRAFLKDYEHIQHHNFVLQDKYDSLKILHNNYQNEKLSLESQIETEWLPKCQSLEQKVSDYQQMIEKLERQKNLNSKEIEFLRQLVKKMEEVSLQNQKEAVAKSTDEYLSNLEKLVDDYRSEISLLLKQLEDYKSKPETNVSIGNKRPRVDNEFRKSQIENSNLENENIKLLATIKDLSNTIDLLETKVTKFNTIETKKEDLRVLQLKSNPFVNDQIVKQKALDALKQENYDLIQKLSHNDETIETIPRSVFERQEIDKTHLQVKIDELIKRNGRLKENFTKKAKSILSTISKFFGFTIEFLDSSMNPNELSSKIKLVSQYTSNKDDLSNSYIILDLSTKALRAYGNYEFKCFCQDLVQEWSNSDDQVPCILSALNINLYKKYVLQS